MKTGEFRWEILRCGSRQQGHPGIEGRSLAFVLAFVLAFGIGIGIGIGIWECVRW